jgi:flagellar hook protein FlgE
VGDVFRITVPDENGSETSYDVQVPAYGGKTAGQTFSSMTDFVEAMKTATNLPADLNLSYLTGATDTFTAKIGTSGNIAGTLTFEKIKDCRLSSGSAVTTTIRPDPVGLFYFDHQGNNLEVIGNRNGEAFRMNVRIDGEVKTALPVGAANNPNGANGVQIGQAKTISLNKGSNDLLGVGLGANVNYVSGTGLPSSAATAIGTTAITSMSQTFFLNESLGENRMTFTVDGIVGTITLPIRAYTGDTFATAIQDRVNQIQDPKTGRIVSGVSVKFDPDNNRLIFTSGTTGQNSQINVVGHPNFGLGKVTQTAGSVPVITNLKQATDDQGNKLYVTADGEVTTADPGSQQNWYPLYLTEGQLTFDTVGKLISPKEGVIYSPFDPQNGSDLLRLNIDYGKYSTQFSSPFSVLSLSQDGYPSGSLNGLDIDAGGTIRANYTNGQTVALGKVMIANFANPNGLKQIGNANYVATSTSGQVVLGQAGADGFGNIKAGALERSNVDITEELVNLITAQRNFQANAKAIETTTQLSQTIIQIRG